MPHLVRHLARGQFAFGGAKGADFRQGVDAGGNVFHQPLLACAVERMRSGKPALVVSRAGKAGVAHHVADRVDMRLRGLVGRIDHDRAARVALNAERFEPDGVRVAGAPLRPQQHIALDDLVRLEVHAHAGIVGLDALVLLAMAYQNTALAQVIGERVDDFVVEESKQLVPVIDQVRLRRPGRSGRPADRP